ncbi:MAG: universal stress protein [Pseudomonadota bacterium]
MDIKRILCCVDFSVNADKAFEAAVDLAAKYQAQLHLIHVLPPVVNPLVVDIEVAVPEESTQALVLKLEEQMHNDYARRFKNGVETIFVVKTGHVSSEILNYLMDEKIDIVVLGAYGLSGVELVLFGSVAKRIAHKAPCTVMIVRDKGN